MTILSFNDWADKYGLEELEQALLEDILLDETEWLSDAYESYVSDAHEHAYEQYRDDKLFDSSDE